jgi:hypothetical protein
MRWALVMAGALLAMAATPAFPSGLELAWNHCFGQAGALSVRTSTCAVNTGSQSMFVSFRPPAGVNRLEGIEVYVDYQISGGALPCWWNFAAGQLRHAQLTPLPVSPPLVLCDNHYFLDHGATGGGWMLATGSDRAQLRGVTIIPAGTGQPVPEDAQQFGFGFRIANEGTVPAASCPGCLNLACIMLNMIRLYSPGQPDVLLLAPHPGSENWITWQANAAQASCPGADQPPPSVPVLPHTWGSIKSIYR